MTDQIPTRCRFGFHKWPKWEQYTERGQAVITLGKDAGEPFGYADLRQRRSCLLCNVMRDHLVKLGG